MPDYSDDDYRLGYFTAPDGKITLLKPLPKNDLLTLFDHHPGQMADLQSQQVELEIRQPPQPAQRSRQSQTSNGYIHLVAWSNCCLLRVLMTAWFRRYREIHGYNKGFYPDAGSLPLTSSKSPINSSNLEYPPVDNLDQFGNPRPLNSPKSPLNPLTPSGSLPLTSSKFPLNSFIPAWPNPILPCPVSPLNSLKSPLNSSNFTPAWLNPKLLDRLEAQLLDSLRSNIANIEEGHGRPATIEYLNFLGYTQASLKESKGDVHRLAQDGLLPRRPGSKLADLGIDLAAWHQALKKSVISRPAEDKGIYRNLQESKGIGESAPLNPPKSPLNSFNFDYPSASSLNTPKIPLNSSNSFSFGCQPNPPPNLPKNPLNSYNFGYAPVDNFDPSQLTYEMLIELINKTDWNLRQLVASLESKLDSDQKSYQLDRARIRAKIKENP